MILKRSVKASRRRKQSACSTSGQGFQFLERWGTNWRSKEHVRTSTMVGQILRLHGSSRQGCESGGGVGSPHHLPGGVVSISGACGGNEAGSARTFTPRLPCGRKAAARGNDLGGEPTGGPEHNEMAAVSKRRSVMKSFGRGNAGSRPR